MKNQYRQEANRPSNWSEYDHFAHKAVSCLVPDQKATLTDGEGFVYEGTCKDVDGMAVVVVTKNGKPFSKITYDYETSIEMTYYADGVKKE